MCQIAAVFLICTQFKGELWVYTYTYMQGVLMRKYETLLMYIFRPHSHYELVMSVMFASLSKAILLVYAHEQIVLRMHGKPWHNMVICTSISTYTRCFGS